MWVHHPQREEHWGSVEEEEEEEDLQRDTVTQTGSVINLFIKNQLWNRVLETRPDRLD